ncbi:multimerin-2a isoform X2 [Pempheris klunzingeri]|uniref:multimerin-2a isoform X2 n=1 Tax=Pempheris klunzingeri TaxID=3127111 RepID=UPI0039811C91
MAAVGELVLVLGLLVSAHCEVRARDHEVELEEEELGGRGAGGGGGAAFPPHPEILPPGATETTLGERGSYLARIGNWCAFEHKRVITKVVCGTERYTVKSQSPCQSGTPNCQLLKDKLTTRLVYRQKKEIVTALLWRCCPGHGGNNCEDTDVQAWQQLQSGDPNREQNDQQADIDKPYDTDYPDNQHNTTQHPGHGHSPDHSLNQATNTHDQQHHLHRQQEHHGPVVDEADTVAPPYPEAPAALPVPHMMALVMSQLQPVLEGFNCSLERLSRQVGDLARDVAQLKSSQLGAEPQAGPPDDLVLDEAAQERLDARLDKVFQHIGEVRRQMDSQQAVMENRLHSQHAMLHYNLTTFKTDIDMKLRRHHKMLQVSLQAMNTTLAELKLDQDQTTEDELEDHLPPPTLPPTHLLQPSDTSALWEAIERLDGTVVNNTVKLDGLMEDMEVTSGSIQQLRRDFKELDKHINQTARTSQIQFMETGLEVETAKEVVLRQVGELAGNLSQQGKQLQEMDVDVDYLYTLLYGPYSNMSGDCDCKGLKADVAQLRVTVANVTELANENRLALDETVEGGEEQWGGAGDWELALEALQRGLQQVNESLALEHSRTRTLDHNLSQLSSSVMVGLAEVSGLKKADRELDEEMQHLKGSFQSLLQDGIRHSDVLELLLGEEELEFLEWPVQDQEAHSIPALQEQLRLLKEQLRGHNLSISSLLGNRTDREEVPYADQPSSSHPLPDDWLPGSMKRSSGGVPARERQLLLHTVGRRPEHGGDGSDLWNLEKVVEELGLRVLRLEEKPCNTSTEREASSSGVVAKLQAEVTWLKRGLEEHLRVFKNVFSNADVLAGSDATLELDKLWQLVKNKDGKKERKRGAAREGSGRGGNHRSRRESSGVVPVPSNLSEDSLLVVAGFPLSVSTGVIAFKASLNRGQFYSNTGTFTAPMNGIYLFVLTLDLRPGPAHVVLRGESGRALGSLHQQEVTEVGPVTAVSLLLLSEGEVVGLELKGGALVESEDNMFTVLLLHQTT